MRTAYEREGSRVIHGDCLDAMRDMDEASVDAIVTDPPYALPGGFMGKTWDAYDGREDAAFAYWLSGLIDGEGHFAIKKHSRGTHAPMFALKLRADELGTLEAIRRHLGIGTITREDREPNPTARWVVQDKAGCQRLVDLLDKYPLRAKKRMDYAVWREAVCEWTNRPRGNRWSGAVDDSRMAQLRERLMAGRRYVDPPWSGHEFQDWCRLWATEALRVLKPGGHLLAFGGTRTYHRLVCAIEDAGFEIRDCLAWLYGQGFPKSLDVAKAIDKAAGAEGTYGAPKSAAHAGWIDRGRMRGENGHEGYQRPWMADGEAVDRNARQYEPATPEAEQWQGWGTALKPAHEPIVLARKPLQGTVAANVLEHGTGALNVDGCRIPTDENRARNNRARTNGTSYVVQREDRFIDPGGSGRWPANVVLDDEAAAMLDEQSGTLTSGANPTRRGSGKSRTAYGDFKGQRECVPARGQDSGGASRFFYTAKASRQDRGEGNTHPTVKPVELMRWLVRLVTPPGGTVLDPFAGSGTTGVACRIEGFDFILIEREAEYVDIIRRRLAEPVQPVLVGDEPASSPTVEQLAL